MIHSKLRTKQFAHTALAILLLSAAGCGSQEPPTKVSEPKAKTSDRPRVRWTPFTPGLVDAAVVRDQVALVNFGSPDGADKPNKQFAEIEALLERKRIQEVVTESNVALFRGQGTYGQAPRGLNIDDYVAGDNRATLVMYSYRIPYKPTLISPVTEETVIDAIQSYRQQTESP